MFPLLVLLLLLLMSCVNSADSLHVSENVIINGSVQCIDKERQALLAFKAALVDYCGYLVSWSSEEGKQNCCNWVGIECSQQTGHVTMLNLGYDYYQPRLGGNISSSLIELQELEFLDLSNLDFGYQPIPDFFGSFTKLQYLFLSDCNLGGTIPSQIGNLSNLERLDLSHNRLDGVIPQSFGNLQNLTSLFLSNCNLAGPIPSQLGNLSNLFNLDLSSNLLDGMIPESLGNICNMKSLLLENNSLTGNLSFVDNYSGCAVAPTVQALYLSANQLNGTLTTNLARLSNLMVLDLSSNSFNGIISEAHLSNLSRLIYLDLSDLNRLDFHLGPQWVPPFQLDYIDLMSCNLGPSFPQWIQTQKTVSYLDISNTGIPNRLPSWFWDFTDERFTFLNLSSNNLGGILPELSSKSGWNGPYTGIDLSSNNFEGPITLFYPLDSINLSNNNFTGDLSFLCQLNYSRLRFLDVSNNLLTGELPDCIEKQLYIVVLNLAHNTLSGEIPNSMGSLSSLQTLNLYNNIFSGVLPKSLSNCTHLRFLDVGMNKFTGNVPSWIGGNMSQLNFLSLKSNNFFGTIPSSLCRLASLHVLDLSINNLSGSIVPCLNNITALVQNGPEVTDRDYTVGYVPYVLKKNIPSSHLYIDHSVIGWQGIDREFGKTLKFLKSIDLSSNNLTGEIPDELTELSELVALNLSRNALQGKVPQQIGRLKSLLSLDLSRNILSHNIPVSLSSLNFLCYLDLSYNKLSGKIPSGSQLQSFDASYYAGNLGLCGPPLTKQCPGEEPPPPVDDNRDSKEDNAEFKKSLYIGMAVGFVTAFWGICGALLLNRRTRHAFFIFVDDFNDWCYVKVAVMLARCRTCAEKWSS